MAQVLSHVRVTPAEISRVYCTILVASLGEEIRDSTLATPESLT
jgi:hypothetical protein